MIFIRSEAFNSKSNTPELNISIRFTVITSQKCGKKTLRSYFCHYCSSAHLIDQYFHWCVRKHSLYFVVSISSYPILNVRFCSNEFEIVYYICLLKFFQTKQIRPIEIELKLPRYVIGEMQNTSSVFDGSLGKVFSTMIIILARKTICNALHLNENCWSWWFYPMCLREAGTNGSTYDFE